MGMLGLAVTELAVTEYCILCRPCMWGLVLLEPGSVICQLPFLHAAGQVTLTVSAAHSSPTAECIVVTLHCP